MTKDMKRTGSYACDAIAEMMDNLNTARDSRDEVLIESAEQTIQEDPLEIKVRKDWQSLTEEHVDFSEYFILLSTGGPATRIIGELEDGRPLNAKLQIQDWGTPWIDYRLETDQDNESTPLLDYAREFYFEL